MTLIKVVFRVNYYQMKHIGRMVYCNTFKCQKEFAMLLHWEACGISALKIPGIIGVLSSQRWLVWIQYKNIFPQTMFFEDLLDLNSQSYKLWTLDDILWLHCIACHKWKKKVLKNFGFLTRLVRIIGMIELGK